MGINLQKTGKIISTFLLAIALFAYWLSLFVEIPGFSDVMAPVCAFLASVFLFRIAIIQQYSRWKWLLMGFSCFIYGLSDTLWVFWEQWFGQMPEDSPILAWGYVVPNILLLAVVWLEVKIRLKKWSLLMSVLNLSFIMIVLGAMIWMIIFNERFQNALALPVLDAILIGFLATAFMTLSLLLALYLYPRVTKTRPDWIVQFVAIALYAFGVLFYVYQLFEGEYTESFLTDGISQLSMAMMAFSTMFVRRVPSAETVEEVEGSLPVTSKRIWLLFAAPLVMVLLHGFFWTEFLSLSVVLFVYFLLHQYTETNIRRDILYQKEKDMNDKLEGLVQERTAELQRSNQQLITLIRQDTMTGLNNRHYFIERLDRTLQEKHELIAVFIIDLDRFKSINDAHGHHIGDEILTDIATRLTAWRRHNIVVARLGGDEFAVLYTGVNDYLLLEKMANELVDIFKQPIFVDSYLFHLSASIGIACYPQDAKDRESLLRYADMAMYHAKDNSQTHCMFYSAQLSEQMQRHHEVELLLKKVKYDEEFMLFFQPQFSAYDRKLVGMEALLRWKSPEKGMIAPIEFIPIAEETGLIVPIGEWVMHQAIMQVKEWNMRYKLDLRMGINISPKQLDSRTFMSLLHQYMTASAVKPWWIDIEITESTTIKSETRSEEILTALANLGVSISIDDFGTGYSSLNYIKRYDIDRLKIAKELVDNIENNRSDLQIVKAIIMMSQALGLVTIAEGVETEEQLAMLLDVGCMEIQGYLLGRPVPAFEFEKMYLQQTDL